MKGVRGNARQDFTFRCHWHRVSEITEWFSDLARSKLWFQLREDVCLCLHTMHGTTRSLCPENENFKLYIECLNWDLLLDWEVVSVILDKCLYIFHTEVRWDVLKRNLCPERCWPNSCDHHTPMELLLGGSELWMCVNGTDEWAYMICVCGDRQKFNLWILEFGHGQTYLGYTQCSLRTVCYSSIIFIYTLHSWITSVFHNKSGFTIMYEACSPFLNVCSHFSLKRKRLGIENWDGETFL